MPALILALLAIAILPAAAAAQSPPPRVLVFAGSYGFHHTSIEYGNQTLTRLAGETGAFSAEVSYNPADISAARLAQFDVVLFNSTTGRFPLSQQQRDDFEKWLGCGGGVAGVHASADANYSWPLYAELIGAQFEAHPHGAGDGEARMFVEDREHPIMAPWRAQESFMIQDELYRWRRDPRGTQDVDVLHSLDESTVRDGIQTGSLPYVPRQAITWTKTFRGKSRVYYTNLGHNEATWDRADFQESLVAGITWVAALRPDAACLGAPERPASAPASLRKASEPAVPAGRPCPAVPGATVLRAGATELDLATPMVPLYISGARSNLVLDLSAQGAGTADLTATSTWASRADDYDLVLTTPSGFAGSERIQPVDDAAESAQVRGLRHCDLLYVDVLNYAALAQGGGIKLKLEVQPGPTVARPVVAPAARLSVSSLRRAGGRYSVALRASAALRDAKLSLYRVRAGGRRVLLGRKAVRSVGPRARRVRLPVNRKLAPGRYLVVARAPSVRPGTLTLRIPR